MRLCVTVSIELPSQSNHGIHSHSDMGRDIQVRKGEKVKFKLRPSKEFTNKIDGWDWIGVYSEEEAVKLKDYCSSKYVTSSDWSKSRLKMELKDFKCNNGTSEGSTDGSGCSTGGKRFRIIYHSAKLKSAIGTSPPFTISD